MAKGISKRPTAQPAQPVMIRKSFQGPLPTPEDLARYNDIEPGLANRIVLMAEKQSDHRQTLEMIAVRSGAWNSRWGLVAGWSIGMASVIGGVWIISIGKSTEGLATLITSLVSLVGIYVYGKRSMQKELEKKRQEG